MEMKHKNWTLRNWRIEDAEALAKSANNFKIWLNLRDGFPHPYSLDDALSFINTLGQLPNVFAIEIDEKAVGSIGYFPQNDVERFNAEIGYWLAEAYWGKGIMSDVVTHLSEYIFENTEIIRIFATPFAHNPASKKVLEKAGFTFKCTLTKAAFKNGQFIDELYYEKIKK